MLRMEKVENCNSPNINDENESSPELQVEIIETIAVDNIKPTPRSPTPRTVPTEPGLSPSSTRSPMSPTSKSSLLKLSPKKKKIKERERRRQNRDQAIKELLLGFKSVENKFEKNEHKRRQITNEKKIEELERRKYERRKRLQEQEDKYYDKKMREHNELEQIVRAKRRKEKNDRLERSRLQREENRIRMETFKNTPVPSISRAHVMKRKKKKKSPLNRRNRRRNYDKRRRGHYEDEEETGGMNAAAALLGTEDLSLADSPMQSRTSHRVRNNNNNNNNSFHNDRYHDNGSDVKYDSNDNQDDGIADESDVDRDDEEVFLQKKLEQQILHQQKLLEKLEHQQKMQKEKQKLLNDKINTNFVESLPGMHYKQRKLQPKVEKSHTEENRRSNENNEDNISALNDDEEVHTINNKMPPLPNVSRDTDAQLHRKIVTLKKQLRDAHKRTGMRLLRATTVSAQDELTQFDPNMSEHYEPTPLSVSTTITTKPKNVGRRNSKKTDYANTPKAHTPKSSLSILKSKSSNENSKSKSNTPKKGKHVNTNIGFLESMPVKVKTLTSNDSPMVPIPKKHTLNAEKKKSKSQSKLVKSKQKKKKRTTSNGKINTQKSTDEKVTEKKQDLGLQNREEKSGLEINSTSDIENVDKAIKNSVFTTNNFEVVGLNSVKDQLRIIFDIVDTKRNRKWLKRDCLVAMAVNGIARKLIASIPILNSFLFPKQFDQLFNDILKTNNNENKCITFENLLQFVVGGNNHNSTHYSDIANDGNAEVEQKKLKTKSVHFHNNENGTSNNKENVIQIEKKKIKKKKSVLFFEEDENQSQQRPAIISEKSKSLHNRNKKKKLQFVVDGTDNTNHYGNNKEESAGLKAKRVPTPGFLPAGAFPNYDIQTEDGKNSTNNAFDFHKDEYADVKRSHRTHTGNYNNNNDNNINNSNDDIIGDFNDSIVGNSERQGYFNAAQLANISNNLRSNNKNEVSVKQQKKKVDISIHQQSGTNNALDLFAEADKLDMEVEGGEKPNQFDKAEKMDYRRANNSENDDGENINEMDATTDSPSRNSQLSENGPESSSLSPVRSSNIDSEDERFSSNAHSSSLVLRSVLNRNNLRYDDNGDIVTNVEVTRGRKIERQLMKTKVVKKKKKRKIRKSPRRKKSSRRSPIQMQEYDVREERYKENYTKNSMSPKNNRHSPRSFRSKVAQSSILPSVTKSPLPIEAYMRATEEKIKEQRRRLKEEKRRFKDSKYSLRKERERFIEYQKMERSPLRKRERQMRRKKQKQGDRKKKPLYGRAYRMDVRPGATVVYKKAKKYLKRNGYSNNMRHSYDEYYGSGGAGNMIPLFNSNDEQNQNVMRSKEEYEYQRKRERKLQKKRNREIDDRWAKKNEELLIKQLEEQKRIMNLRYKVAKHRLEKRSKIGAVAANTYKPKFTRDSLISMYNSNSSGADDFDEEEALDDNYYEHNNKSNMHSNYKYANNVLNYDQIQQQQKQQKKKHRLKDDEEFLEATSLADLPSDLFNPVKKDFNVNVNSNRRRVSASNNENGKRNNNQFSLPVSSELKVRSSQFDRLAVEDDEENESHQRKARINPHMIIERGNSANNGRSRSSNGRLDDVLPNINDVLNIGVDADLDTLHDSNIEGAGKKQRADADPCQKDRACQQIACDIQFCLGRNNYKVQRCQHFMDRYNTPS